MSRTRVTRQVLLLAILSLPVAVVAETTYKVNVNTLLDGADVKVDYQAYDGILVVSLKNIGENRARCEVNFDASPQIPARKTKYVDPGKTVTTDLRADRMWFDVDVDVKCTAADARKKKKGDDDQGADKAGVTDPDKAD
jgi:hypothetical protein